MLLKQTYRLPESKACTIASSRYRRYCDEGNNESRATTSDVLVQAVKGMWEHFTPFPRTRAVIRHIEFRHPTIPDF